MKNKKVLFISLIVSIFSLTLSSCSKQNDNLVLIPKVSNTVTEENFTLDISTETLQTYIEGKRTFLLYLGSPLCHFCNELKPLLIKYVQTSHIELYHINTISDEFLNNYVYYVNEMGFRGTPTILLFSAGELVHTEVGTYNLQTQSQVTLFFKNLIKTTNLYVGKDENATLPSKYVTISYDFNDLEHQKVINTYFFPLFTQKAAYTFLVDNETFSLTFDTGEPYELSTQEATISPIVDLYIAYF